MWSVLRIRSCVASSGIQFLALRSASRPWNRRHLSTCFGRLLQRNVSLASSPGPKTLMSLTSLEQRSVIYCLIFIVFCIKFSVYQVSSKASHLLNFQIRSYKSSSAASKTLTYRVSFKSCHFLDFSRLYWIPYFPSLLIFEFRFIISDLENP